MQYSAGMGSLSELKVRSRPAPIEAYAADNLQFIRDTMERAAGFTAVPGEGGVLIGLSALAAGSLASRYASPAQLWVWVVEGILAACIGGVALCLKSRRISYPLTSRATKRALLSFVTPIAAGAILTVAIYRAHVLS